VKQNVQRWKDRLYNRQAGWVDGTTQFAALVKKYLRPDMQILDMGAGPGKLGPINFRGSVATVVGVDPDWAIKENAESITGCSVWPKAYPSGQRALI
jgi:hypothetical protein